MANGKPGAPPGTRYGGRGKGTPNKRSQAAIDRLHQLNFDPLEELVKIANGTKLFRAHLIQKLPDGSEITKEVEVPALPEQRIRVTVELMAYAWPKRKSVEIRDARQGPDQGDFDLTNLSEDEITALKEIAEASQIPSKLHS